MKIRLLLLLSAIFILSFKPKNYGCPNNCLFIKDILRDFEAKVHKNIQITLCGDTTMSFQLLNCNGNAEGKYYYKGKLFLKGYYADGNIDATWNYQSYYCDNDAWADFPSECMVLVKNGEWKYYDDKGKLIKEETWKVDSLVSVKVYN